MRFKFVDKRPEFVGSSPYAVPNERMSILRDLLKLTAPGKVGSICSGGEVPLTVMLPFAQKVYAVDHNYGSLLWATMKATTIEALSGAEILKLLIEKDGLYWRDLCRERMGDELPPSLLGAFFPAPSVGYYYSSYKDEIVGGFDRMRNLWKTFPTYLLDQAREKLDQLTFIHGDLTDLTEFSGPLDVLYVSNAPGHSNYKKSSPLYDEFASLLGEVGHVIETNSRNQTAYPLAKGFKRVDVIYSTHPFEHPNEQNWFYYLHEKE